MDVNLKQSNNEISISLLTPEQYNAWDDYVNQHKHASIYHLSQWKTLIEQTFNHRCFYLLARNENNQICGVLPCVNLNSRLFGNFFVSMPYFNYGGALADSDEIKQQLNHYLQHIASQLKVSHIQYRESEARQFNELPLNTDKVNMVLTLPESPEALGKLIGSKRRSQIKRPIREGVTHTIGGMELLDDFYQVFCFNMRDLGTPVYSKIFFKNILEQFEPHTRIVVVYWQGKPVSAGFLMRYRDRLEIPWASTVQYANKISVNMYLYWQILCFAIETQCTEFDFGRSTINEGTYRFKRQWGAEPQQCYWYYWVPAQGELPNLSPKNKKFELAISIWKKLPLAITNRLGPLIVKNLP
jgi:FemAB-related protein (PEP-CTERM system-associated)